MQDQILDPVAILRRRLQALADGVNADWGIYIRFLDNGDEIAINADALIDTMSLIKVPILVALMKRVDRGEVDLDQQIRLEEDHKRLGTGVLRLFSAGAAFTLRDAAWMMEVVSDNTATDICLEAAGGVQAVNNTVRDLGIDGIEVTGTVLDWFRSLAGSMDPDLARVPPGTLAARGYPQLDPFSLAEARARYHFEGGRPFSLATARGLGELMAQIHSGACASPDSCEEMLRILSGQQLRQQIPKYVSGASFAHKTGSFEPFVASEVAIAKPYRGCPVVMCFLNQRHRGTKPPLEDCVARMGELVVLAAEQRQS
jgi:beta-lactamase class A